MRIDRKKKLTIPGIEVVIPKLGFPRVGNVTVVGSGEEAAATSASDRADLVVKFELEAADEDDSESDNNGMQANINIASQAELDKMLASQKAKAQRQVMRNLLLLLKQQKEL